jgi:hypothetical protein
VRNSQGIGASDELAAVPEGKRPLDSHGVYEERSHKDQSGKNGVGPVEIFVFEIQQIGQNLLLKQISV